MSAEKKFKLLMAVNGLLILAALVITFLLIFVPMN
ncbi:MAG: hypothetical protein JWP00_1641 [Chloroflexi bacterium]|jgi:hypothetical protein|nr:hypothetical protein [Chloroflexota bacterium]